MSDQAHIALMEAVARHFFGEPNARLSKNGKLRFGTNGSKSVDLKKGCWFDHEADEGGDPLDLIMLKTGFSTKREAYGWAEQHGFWVNGKPKPSSRKIVATYDYTDESGELLFQKVRYEPKDFLQRRPDVNGGWIWKLGDVRRVLYRLPEAIETIANGHMILVVEGEKDVDNCWRLGIPATCNEGGANKWQDALTPGFKDADVVIVPDNDEPGRKHAEDVAGRLDGIAHRVRVLDLAKVWPRCPDKGDISNWIEAGRTAEQLYSLIEGLLDWKPAVTATALGEWDAGDDPGSIPPREWLLGNQFCKEFVSSLFAAGGVGKSALRLVQFISLALGRPLCGQHVFLRCRVLLISLEDSDTELQRRIEAVLIHFDRLERAAGRDPVQRSQLKGWLFCKSVTNAKLAVRPTRFERAAGELEAQIRDAIERLTPDLVGLDPFVKLHDLSENDAGDMNFVCGLLTQVTIEKRIAVDIPHHVHKGDIAPGDADAGRGSSGIKDAGRLVSTLTVMSEKEAKDFDIEPEDRFDYVRLDRAKVNIARRAGAAEWFKLAGVPLNNGNETYPSGDTVQVAEPWKPPETSAWKGLSYACLNKALDSIDGGVVNDKGFTGERYSAAPQAKRAAWKAVQVIVGMEADKSDADCKAMVKAWLKSGTLVEKDYTDPIQRKEVKGLFVDNSKRPGKTDSEERL